jgi:hypothetical protein
VAYLEVVQLLELLHWYHRKSYRVLLLLLMMLSLMLMLV